jgi:hypothetical protein
VKFCTAFWKGFKERASIKFKHKSGMLGFMFFRKQTHVLSMPSLQSSPRRVDVVFIVNGIHILIDVIIVNTIRANFVSQIVFLGKKLRQ